MQERFRIAFDPPHARFRIRNSLTGAYIWTTKRMLEFQTRREALEFIVRRRLSREVYYTEVYIS